MMGWGKIRLAAIAVSALICMTTLAACNYTGLDAGKSNADLLKEAVANTKAAKSYHLSLTAIFINGLTSKFAADVDSTNNRIKLDIITADQTIQYVKIGKDVFISEDGGQTFSQDNYNSSSLDDLTKELDDFEPAEADKAGSAIKDGNPAIGTIEGVATKHIIANHKDIPSLIRNSKVGDATISDTSDMMEIWLITGARPTLRRLKVVAKSDNKDVDVTLEWSKLDEPVAIQTPKVVETSNADLLKKAAANMKAATSYSLEADVTQGDQRVKLNGLFDIANKTIKMDVDVGGQKVGIIVVGQDVYLSTDNDQTYTKTDQGASIASGFTSFTAMWDTFRPDQVDRAKSVLKDGSPRTEKIDGILTRHITADSSLLALLNPDGSGNNTTGKIDLWISTGNKPYVYQMIIDGTTNGQAVKGTLKWGRFDEKFDIVAPITPK